MAERFVRERHGDVRPPGRDIKELMGMCRAKPLPTFLHHRDPIASGSVIRSEEVCDCCRTARGVVYSGSTYCLADPTLCPWCIADGSAHEKFDAYFFDADFVDENFERIEVSEQARQEVLNRTIGFATFNPIGWWVHCGEPAEYVRRDEPYEMIFECRLCHRQHIIEDLD